VNPSKHVTEPIKVNVGWIWRCQRCLNVGCVTTEAQARRNGRQHELRANRRQEFQKLATESLARR
jgi:hypothetical protein